MIIYWLTSQSGLKIYGEMHILLTDLQIYEWTDISKTDLITIIWKDSYSIDLQIYGGTDILLVGTEPLVV